MSRFFAPVLCFCLAGWVYYRSTTEAVVVFAGLQGIVGDDPYLQAVWTGRLLLLLGCLFSGLSVWQGRRSAASTDVS